MSRGSDCHRDPAGDVRNAVTASLEAVAIYHNEVTAANDKAVAKIADAARALGWPEHVVAGIVDQLQTVAKIHLQITEYVTATWQEHIQSWPGLSSTAGGWPSAKALMPVHANQAQFWSQMAQAMMSQWTKSFTLYAAEKSEDRD